MSDDMSDLFGASSSAASGSSTSPPRSNMPASSFAAFGEEDDGFGSLNPFADLQSSRIGAFEASEDISAAASTSSVFDDTAARSRTSSNATERNGWETTQPRETHTASSSEEAATDRDAEEVDRVLVSPFVSAPGSSQGGEGGPYDQEQDPMASTAAAYSVHDEAIDPYQAESVAPSFDITHLEDGDAARGFADTRDVQQDSEPYQEEENAYTGGNDAASIRTVGLESDAASLKSQKTQVCPSRKST